ncbi:MAG TPA: hypothetical protein VH062_07605 [Polyangiaceae bacterium]|jgi:hypothetical protein|nr:hypothetical protein [Polyangiaceae bacterium]
MIQGTWRYAAGTAGTVNLPTGATVRQIVCHATTAGTVTILGGASVPVPAGATLELRFPHDSLAAGQVPGGSAAIVFTGTDSYFVESVGPGTAVP